MDIINESKILVSPRLKGLKKALDDGIPNAEAEFWEETARAGTPLIEQITTVEFHKAVTFIIKGETTAAAPAQPSKDQDPDNGEVDDSEGIKREQLEMAAEQVEQYLICINSERNWNMKEHIFNRLPGTKVFYKSYLMPQSLRTTYILSKNNPLVPEMPYHNMKVHPHLWFIDPLNPKTHVDIDMNEKGDFIPFPFSALKMPEATPFEWNTPNSATPKGRVETHLLSSKILQNQRQVTMYLPPHYEPRGKSYPFMVLFDGISQFHPSSTFQTVVENLMAAEEISPMIIICVQNFFANIARRAYELSCNPFFLGFIEKEVIPWAVKRYPIELQSPQNCVAGCSTGGLQALYMGFQLPALFPNVIAFSPTLSWGPGDKWWLEAVSQEPNFKPWWKKQELKKSNWLVQEFEREKMKPISIYLAAGALELKNEMLNPIRELRDVLKKKAYHFVYKEFMGAHENIWWQGLWGSALSHMLKMKK